MFELAPEGTEGREAQLRCVLEGEVDLDWFGGHEGPLSWHYIPLSGRHSMHASLVECNAWRASGRP